MHSYCIQDSIHVYYRKQSSTRVKERRIQMNGNLRRIREALALSRRDLAVRSDVNESTIYRAEHGMTTLRPSTIQKLAKVLEVSPTEITKPEDVADSHVG